MSSTRDLSTLAVSSSIGSRLYDQPKNMNKRVKEMLYWIDMKITKEINLLGIGGGHGKRVLFAIKLSNSGKDLCDLKELKKHERDQ